MPIMCSGPTIDGDEPCPTGASIEPGLAGRRGWRKPAGCWVCPDCDHRVHEALLAAAAERERAGG